MKLNTKRKQIVEEVPYGVYVWEMPNGQWIGDDDGNFLNIAAMKGDKKRIQQLRDAVASYGITEGKPFYLSGHRQVTDEEFEYQKQRMAFGLVPDEMDVPAFREELSK
ncbi:hypothetical protein SEA_BILLNYE_19 [Streptomyces phage BillNye]|uniref:Uncharacterized protein n=2 Tax=Wilnyevirus billnye TaxID=2560486 RepID=A0A2L1IVL1_9CAUD|nr:hypothetical protein FDJ30_gp212 [Streptomyces phage BillNye]AVD99221.1 hypothetical protein SEA_BILLNYE_19 [Streptomyces phage BillNye]QBZ72305.1 hypothetical protein SEA_CIRCINUS_21 [Streptomyces phage Circinus]